MPNVTDDEINGAVARWTSGDFKPAIELIQGQETATAGAFLVLRILEAMPDAHSAWSFLDMRVELAELVDFEERNTSTDIDVSAWGPPMHAED